MRLTNSKQTLLTLAESDTFFKDATLGCWRQPEGDLGIYIFSKIFETQEELHSKYKDLRDHVAISFQSQMLESSSERWNLYLFYFVTNPVDNSIKQEIEQDKFSTRKIVSDSNSKIDDEVIMKTIDKELFDFNVSKRSIPAASMDNLLRAEHPSVYMALELLGDKIEKQDFDKLLTQLNDEKN